MLEEIKNEAKQDWLENKYDRPNGPKEDIEWWLERLDRAYQAGRNSSGYTPEKVVEVEVIGYKAGLLRGAEIVKQYRDHSSHNPNDKCLHDAVTAIEQEAKP